MNTVRHNGFTIIETMLFLSVTGALAIAILAGSSVAISQQRYKDAALSLESLLQSQYSNTSNVVNSRDDALECVKDADNKLQVTTGNISQRGSSECVVLGRYIRFTPNGSGTDVTTSSVIGLRVDNAPVTDDIGALKQYIMTRSSIDEETDPVSWGAQVVSPRPQPNPLNVVVLVLRSPLSGSLRTFVPSGSIPNTDDREISSSSVDSANSKQILCLDTTGFSTGQPIGITIQAGAGGANAIELVSEGSTC